MLKGIEIRCQRMTTMVMTSINGFFNWITRIALLNVLWIIFTIFGLGFLGVFPATVAVFTIARKWVTGETDIPVMRTFWKYYKKDFIQSNILGYLLSVVGYVLYLDFVFLTVSPSNMVYLLTIPFVIIAFIFILMLLYVFPAFVYYDMKLFQILKSSFFIMVLNPFQTLIMLIGCFALMVILWTFQSVAIFFGPAVLAMTITMPAQQAFQKVREKNALKYNEKMLSNH